MLNLHNILPLKFPENFLWGSATAGHQIEGKNIHSGNYEREMQADWPEKSGKACNHWELYREDIEMIKYLGHKGYRLSLEWSRLEPEEGVHDKEALNRYLDMLTRLKNAGIKTFVTLHHFSCPAWFDRLGGFEKRENVRFFERHIEYIAPKIAELTDFWCVSNEFNICGGNGPEAANLRANELYAHAKGYHIIKQYSKAPISSAHALRICVPQNPYDKFDTQLAELDDWMSNEFFFHGIRTGEIVFPYRDGEYVPELKDAIDYWAINYYTRRIISARKKGIDAAPFPASRLPMIDQRIYLEEFFPEGLTTGLLRLKDKPVYITENGVCADDDRWRIIKMILDLAALLEAGKNGVDIKGYLHWSLMDNYEWGSFVPRFGLVSVDFKDFRRTPKPSAAFLKEVIAENGISHELLKKYLPELPEFTLYKGR